MTDIGGWGHTSPTSKKRGGGESKRKRKGGMREGRGGGAPSFGGWYEDATKAGTKFMKQMLSGE